MKIVYRIFQNSGLIVVSLGLVFGGISIVKTQIPFWSLFYGLTAIALGILTTLVTFNELTKNRDTGSSDYHLIPCKICAKQTLAPALIETVVCTNCQYRMAIRLNLTVATVFVLLIIPVTYHLTQQEQDIRQQAKEPSPICEIGVWRPTDCKCGLWDQKIVCNSNTQGRSCGGLQYCCSQNNAGEWTCSKQ